MRPDFGQVEDVPAEFLGIIRAEDLYITGPGGVLASLDSVDEVLRVPVWVGRCEFGGFFVGEGFAALVCFAVDLDVVEGSVGLDPLVGVAGEAVHMAVRAWSATITEEVHDLVDGFLMRGEVVPECGGVLQVRLGVPLLSVYEHGKLGRVSEEEDRGVVENPIPVALVGVELQSKTTRVTSTVRRSLLTTDG